MDDGPKRPQPTGPKGPPDPTSAIQIRNQPAAVVFNGPESVAGNALGRRPAFRPKAPGNASAGWAERAQTTACRTAAAATPASRCRRAFRSAKRPPPRRPALTQTVLPNPTHLARPRKPPEIRPESQPFGFRKRPDDSCRAISEKIVSTKSFHPDMIQEACLILPALPPTGEARRLPHRPSALRGVRASICPIRSAFPSRSLHR